MSDFIAPKPARTKDFKIGQFHGRASASKPGNETGLQRHLFSSQVVEVIRSRDKSKNSLIRLFAYELPLGFYRGWCVDLAGYDQNRNLYLIELKRGGSNENINTVVSQVNRYAEVVERLEVKRGIEDEFRHMYHMPFDYKFRGVKKVILAEKKYFKNLKHPLTENTEDIEFLYFGTDQVLKKPSGGIKLRVWPKK